LEKEAREKLEMELIKTNKLAEIGRRVEGIVHNMNSPLNSIIGYAQLMKKEIGENEDLEKILKSGKLIAHYIKTLQQKIKNDNVSMYRLIDVNKLLKDELELFKNNLFFKHHVKTITSFEKKLPKINAVYGDVSMCITNIINNALDAMKNSEEKILRISTSTTKDNFIKITIQDTGCGIEKKDLPHIFEPYYSTKSYPQGSGYGLGLAIARYIVDKYKGKILVKSEVNKGTDFTILFPVGK
jgi:signal transduction histidine kinase